MSKLINSPQTTKITSRPIFKILLTILLISLAFAKKETREITINSISDAFIGVTVFVAFTFLVFYGLESLFKVNLNKFLENHKRLQIPIASILGMLPGCGGAVIVVTSFSAGHISFGSVVATLISTMGDAAFLIIAKDPKTAILLLPTCCITGIVFGVLVDKFYTLKIKNTPKNDKNNDLLKNKVQLRDKLALIFLVPGFIFGTLRLTFVDFDTEGETLINYFGFLGGITFLLFGLTLNQKVMPASRGNFLVRSNEETAFITIWVILSFVGYEYLIYFSGINIEDFFISYKLYIPLIAVLIGLIPGCGPQIVVTTLYINGLVPFSGLLANSISNDGDALFPAIAVAPHAAIKATVLTTIPALLLSYAFYLLSV